MLLSTAACRLWTEQPHTEGQEFRPSTFPENTHRPPYLGATRWTLGGTGWKCNPLLPEVRTFSKKALYSDGQAEVGMSRTLETNPHPHPPVCDVRGACALGLLLAT